MKLLSILLLVIPPIAYALWNGRNGISHPARDQVIVVGIIMLVSSFWIGVSEMSWLMIVKALAVSYAGYLLFFPPLMNAVRLNKTLKKVHLKWDRYDIIWCLSHLSDTAIPDKWKLYRAIPWPVRLGVYLALFVVAVLWFVYE